MSLFGSRAPNRPGGWTTSAPDDAAAAGASKSNGAAPAPTPSVSSTGRFGGGVFASGSALNVMRVPASGGAPAASALSPAPSSTTASTSSAGTSTAAFALLHTRPRSSGGSGPVTMTDPTPALVVALRSCNIGSPSGIAAEQMQRLQAGLAHIAAPVVAGEAMARGLAPGTIIAAEVHARLRLVDLFHHWTLLPDTQGALRDLVAETLALVRPVAPAPAVTTPEANSGLQQPPPVSPQSDGPMESSPALPAGQDMSGHFLGVDRRDSDLSATFTLAEDNESTPASRMVSLAMGDGGPAEQPPDAQPPRDFFGGGGPGSMTIDVTPPREDNPRSPVLGRAAGGKSPRVGSIALPHPPAAAQPTPPHERATGFHIVDEVDAAHARGQLSPRCSPMSTSLHAPQRDAATLRAAPSLGDSISSLGGTLHHNNSNLLESHQLRPPSPLASNSGDLRRVRSAVSANSSDDPLNATDYMVGSRSPSPAASLEGHPLDGIRPTPLPLHRTASQNKPNIPKAISTPRSPPREVAAPPPPPEPVYATYTDIPRFYFPDGRPDPGRGARITGPVYAHHFNPHLKAFDGIAIPPAQLEQIKAAAAAAKAQENGGSTSPAAAKKKKGGAASTSPETSPGKNAKQANSESFSLSSLDPSAFEGLNIPQPGFRLAPLAPLVVMEDDDVIPFIQREMAKVPPPPSSALAKAPAPRGKASAAGKRPGTSTGTAAAKAEASYRTALHAALQRIVTQAFGLSKYFTYMIMRRLIVETAAAEQAAGAKGGPAPAVVDGVPVGTVSIAAIKAFYESHLRHRSPVRRMFEAFIFGNLNTTTNANGSSTGSQPHTPPPAPVSGVAGSEAGGAGLAGSSSGGSASHRTHLVAGDFGPYLDALLESHPGLAFLRQATDFQQKYLDTIVARIFFDCDQYDTGRIAWGAFERSRLPDAIRQVDAAEDINSVLNYFSYEHFYVIYCRFWELDTDRDMLISADDLSRYFPEGTGNSKAIERIFQGHGRPLTAPCAPSPPAPSKGKGLFAAKRPAPPPDPLANKRMNYDDFVWFCLAEEDKTAPRSIRYWFRVLDLDGDGIICGYELEQFYHHTRAAMAAMTTESIPFTDIMCQVADMLPALARRTGLGGLQHLVRRTGPSTTSTTTVAKGSNKGSAGNSSSSGTNISSPPAGFTLKALLAHPESAHVALNMILNVVKFLTFEQRDPFVSHQDRLLGGFEATEWDRFARAEYDRMACEADE